MLFDGASYDDQWTVCDCLTVAERSVCGIVLNVGWTFCACWEKDCNFSIGSARMTGRDYVCYSSDYGDETVRG